MGPLEVDSRSMKFPKPVNGTTWSDVSLLDFAKHRQTQSSAFELLVDMPRLSRNCRKLLTVLTEATVVTRNKNKSDVRERK